MTYEALIRDGIVVEIATTEPARSQHFAGLGWVDAAGKMVDGRPVQVGDVVAGDGFAAPAQDEAAETAREAAWQRRARDALLGQSDWTQMPDAALHDDVRAEWRTYRTLLRAMPQQSGFPHKIDWPLRPGQGGA